MRQRELDCSRALPHFAFGHLFHEAFALGLAPLTPRLALRKDQPAAPLVNFDNFNGSLMPTIRGIQSSSTGCD